MGRTESGRAAGLAAHAVMEEIVDGAWSLAAGEVTIRRCALATASALVVLGGVAVVLVRGLPNPVLVVAALAAPALAAVLVVAAFRAVVLATLGDGYGLRPDPIDMVRHAIRRTPDVLVTGARSFRRGCATPLASAITVVNGVGADEAIRTSRALVAHCWGHGARLRSGRLLLVMFLGPVIAVDTLVVWRWHSLGLARPLAFVAAALSTVGALVAGVALDAALRGALLRVARGDDSALDPALVARFVRTPDRHRQPHA